MKTIIMILLFVFAARPINSPQTLALPRFSVGNQIQQIKEKYYLK